MESVENFKKILLKYINKENLVENHNEKTNADLVTEIKKQYVSQAGKRLTNFTKEKLELGPASLSFNYKRDDLNLEIKKSDLYHFGVTKNDPHDCTTYLLNSGQAGLNVLLIYLKFNLKIATIECTDHHYFGAQILTDLYQLKIKNPDKNKEEKVLRKPRVLWICSSYFNLKNYEKIAKRQYTHVVIDTTCWAQDSKILKMLLTNYKNSNIFLIRSSSKLDMGGIEYGSLGVLLLMIPPKKKSDNTTVIFKELISLTGAAPSFDDIPPYFLDPDFFKMNNKRILEIEKVLKTIEKNNRWKLPVGIKTDWPEHQKYFFIVFKNKSIDYRRLLEKSFIFSNIPYLEIASYGFNESIVSFKDDENQPLVLRICPGIGEEEADKLIKAIDVFFQLLGNIK